MKVIVLRFGPYKYTTPSGMDGTRIQFNFTKVDSCLVGSTKESQASTPHRLIVGVAARIDWVDDEVALPKILFEIGAPNIIDIMSPAGNLPDEIPTFVPHGACLLDRGRLGDIEGAMLEVELPAKRTRRLERK